MAKTSKKELQAKQSEEFLKKLKVRFEKNMNRHKGLTWAAIEFKLKASPSKLWSLYQMEETGGEPDVVMLTKNINELLYIDCSPESPKDRRSVCYDKDALESRKENKPKNSAMNMASEMGTELLDEKQYRALHQFGKFDTKTSSWIKTPADIRKLKGALFADFRYNNVFIYHNGAESYYAARGFRTYLSL